MLKSLYISNYVLIDELDIRFDDGFSVITGETGAGKSIILGALSLVLGERADSHSIRSGSEKCVIEAVFDISAYHLENFFKDCELEYDGDECIFRRELYASGKSRAFINDSPAPLSVVKELGNRLIDVHSQHQNLMLADTHFQLRVVDLMAQDELALSDYRRTFASYSDVSHSLDELRNKASQNRKEEDFIRFQLDELVAANLREGEQQELEEELETLSHTEEIKTALYKVTDILVGGNSISVVSQLKEALASLKSIKNCYSKASEYCQRLDSALIDISDMARETNVLKDDVEFDPERLEFVNRRLQTFFSLQHKHNVRTVEELIVKRNDFALKINEIESYDEDIERLTRQQQELYDRLVGIAGDITTLRKKSAAAVEEKLTAGMTLLGMLNSRFSIAFTPRNKPMSDGMDEITFLFSANRNETLRPVAQTASGGEISRLMLCLKSMIAGYSTLPTIIFDEIDIGVSGEIADKMAGIMQDLGSRMQVISITHLPQIASKGKAHFFVYKEDTAERTITQIRRIADNERITEIARMLSGSTVTPAAVENAKALLSVH